MVRLSTAIPVSTSRDFKEVSLALVPSTDESQRGQVSSGHESHPIQQLREETWLALPFTHLIVSPETTKEDIVQAFSESHEVLANYFEEAREFIREICRCNVSVVDGPFQDHFTAEKDREVARLTEPLLAGQLPTPDGFGVDIFYKDKPELQEYLLQGLIHAHDYWLTIFFQTIVALSEIGLIGRIRWTVEGVCELKLSQRSVDGTQTETRLDHEFARRESHFTIDEQVKTHCLMRCTVSTEFKEAPLRAVSLWKKIPSWLQAHVRVVDGEVFNNALDTSRIKQGTTTEVFRIVTPRYHDDPAITLLDTLVLTMWDAHDDEPLIPCPRPPRQPSVFDKVEMHLSSILGTIAFLCGVGVAGLALWRWSGLFLVSSIILFVFAGLLGKFTEVLD